MPRTKIIAKRDAGSFFKKGDKATMVPILYEKDTVIRDEILGIFKDNVLLKIFEDSDLKCDLTGGEIRLMDDKLIAPKGSWKDSYIEMEDGREYPSSLFEPFLSFFEKA